VLRWLVPLVLVLGALGAAVGPGAASAAPGRRELRVAQAEDRVAVAASEIARAERSRAALAAQHAALDRTYDAQKIEIDKLKRQKASWRRDRALRTRLAESVETAKKLEALARELTLAQATLGRARARGVAAIDAVMASAPDARRRELAARRRAWAPPPPIKRIVLPDDALDPLADPEELDDQAAALADSEAELAGTIARLDDQARRYDGQALLRRQHERAAELVIRDETDPRPGVAGGGGRALGAEADGFPAAPGEDLGEPQAAFDGEASALSAVIDPGTVDVLRSAGRSNDPARRAAAARAARDDVKRQLDRLKKQRAAIEGRARELRRAP
jgi:hypothetical protein